MKNLTNLVIQYKKTKNKKLIEEIFKELAKMIKDKARYVYKHVTFKYKDFQFKLCEVQQETLKDVEQDLALEILKMINRFDIKKDFNTYLLSSLWFWHPSFLNRDFLNQLNNASLTAMTETDNEIEDKFAMKNLAIYPKLEEPINLDNLFENLTEQERKLLKLLIENSELKQEELAKFLNLTQPRVCQMFENIQKKYKK
jgi:uncharacterized membrane protein